MSWSSTVRFKCGQPLDHLPTTHPPLLSVARPALSVRAAQCVLGITSTGPLFASTDPILPTLVLALPAPARYLYQLGNIFSRHLQLASTTSPLSHCMSTRAGRFCLIVRMIRYWMDPASRISRDIFIKQTRHNTLTCSLEHQPQNISLQHACFAEQTWNEYCAEVNTIYTYKRLKWLELNIEDYGR